MKLWRTPWPWDYHGQGALVSMANTREEAIEKAKLFYAGMEYHHYSSSEPEWEKTTEVNGPVYEDGGCDC